MVPDRDRWNRKSEYNLHDPEACDQKSVQIIHRIHSIAQKHVSYWN